MGISKAVIAARSLRDGIGSEWSAKGSGANTVQVVSVDTTRLTVRLSDDREIQVMDFLKDFKAAIPKDKIPTWYARLLEDKLL